MEKQQYSLLLELFEKNASETKKARYLAFFRANDENSEVAVPMLVKETAHLVDTAVSCEGKRPEKPVRHTSAKTSNTAVAVVEYSDLPEELQKKYDRIQAIVPVRASMHADLKREGMKEPERKRLAKELTELEDERIALWADMDAFETENNVQLWHRKMKRNESEDTH